MSSSMVESLIKEVNYRVKGTEKFWDNPEGAEAILQVRAAQLSDDERLERLHRQPPRQRISPPHEQGIYASCIANSEIAE